MKLLLLSLCLFLDQVSFAMPVQFALVYDGPGACPEDCSKAAADMAKKAGLTPKMVGPEEISPEVFKHAKIWIQPGGMSKEVAKAMDPVLKENIKAFVGNGGGYVGFCAGAFFATELISNSDIPGLGILPGVSSRMYVETGNENPIMLDINWNKTLRSIYWEGGPFLLTDSSFKGSIIAHYPNKAIATLHTRFKKGRVFVTGLHPEAPEFWRTSSNLTDTDGLDEQLAIEMIKWASHLN